MSGKDLGCLINRSLIPQYVEQFHQRKRMQVTVRVPVHIRRQAKCAFRYQDVQMPPF